MTLTLNFIIREQSFFARQSFLPTPSALNLKPYCNHLKLATSEIKWQEHFSETECLLINLMINSWTDIGSGVSIYLISIFKFFSIEKKLKQTLYFEPSYKKNSTSLIHGPTQIRNLNSS